MADIQDRTFSARLDCHYLLLAPAVMDAETPLVVTLHGFGGNAETMLQLTSRLFDAQAVITALQGPYQFFRDPDAREVGYGWITSRRPAESIRLHHEMVLHAAEAVGREFGISPDRRVLGGFSQSVSLNYRFAATHPDVIRGVIGICGGLPGDWETGTYQPVTAAVLHIARRGDQYYPPDVTKGYAERLRRRAADVEFHLIDGGHQMPSGGGRIVWPWLRRILTK
jgi:phospholipase/carboxylesterase